MPSSPTSFSSPPLFSRFLASLSLPSPPRSPRPPRSASPLPVPFFSMPTLCFGASVVRHRARSTCAASPLPTPLFSSSASLRPPLVPLSSVFSSIPLRTLRDLRVPSSLPRLPTPHTPLTLFPVSTRLQPRRCAPKCPSFVALPGFSKKIFARALTARNSLTGLDFHHGLVPIAPRVVTAHHRLCAHQSVRPPPVWRTPSATRRPPNRVGQLVSDHHPDGPDRHRPAGTKRTPASAACAKDTPCAVVGVATRQPPSAARVTPRSPQRVVTPSSPPTHNPGCETTAITRAASPRALGRRHRGGNAEQGGACPRYLFTGMKTRSVPLPSARSASCSVLARAPELS